VEIAKVAMMVARKLAIDELHIAEQALPLANLDRNFLATDALLTPEGQPAYWPKADVIIGNPPFIGAKMLKPERGPDYVNAVRRAYPDVRAFTQTCKRCKASATPRRFFFTASPARQMESCPMPFHSSEGRCID